MTVPSSPSPTLTGTDTARVIFAVVGLTLAAITVAFLGLAILAVFGFEPSGSPPGPLLFAAEAVVLWLALWLVLIRGRGFTWTGLGWVRVSWGWMAMGVAGCAAVYAAAISLQLLFVQFAGADEVRWTPDALPLFPATFSGFVLSIAFGAVAVPIFEEFLFRGVLYRWMRGRWGTSTATLASSVVFALAHPPGTGGMLQIFVVALLLAWLFERSGSLWPSMALHGCNNAIGICWIYAALWSGLA